ncbi:MAG: PKD domain-containing protein [Bacteriovoracaceae bacterium]|nr:PKD domain-containing protein [Bacteriovoracaceae bacterium]
MASSTSNILKFKIQSSGDHQITLAAEDNAGNLSSLKKTIHINVPPVAALTATPVTGPAPLLVELDASASSDDGALTYHYNFGDGSPILVTNVNRITHEYQAGSYTASVKVVDHKGLESNSTIKIQSVAPSPEDAPQISIVTKNAYDLYLNYLQGSPIEMDATSSTGGNGEISHYEWKKDDEVIGNGSTVAIPSDSIGQYNYSLSITNSNNLISKKAFVISISPNVTPEITVDQPNAYAPSDVSLSVANTNDFVGIKILTWSNKYTGEKLSAETYSELIGHVGETIFQLKIEDTYGYIYEKNIKVTVLNDGPYIEGPSMIDVILDGPQEFKYTVSGDLSTKIALKEQIQGVSINIFGELLINRNEAPSGVEFITLIASNGLRIFEKEIKVSWLKPTPLATIPAGFYGTYQINAPSSVLHKVQVEITEEMTNGLTAINFLEVKTNDGTYLITKTEGGDLRNPLKISTSGSVLGAHMNGVSNKFIDLFGSLTKLSYSNIIYNCKFNMLFKSFPLDDPRVKALPTKEYPTLEGLRVFTLGRSFSEQNLTEAKNNLLEKIAATFDSRLDDKSKTIYLVDQEVVQLKDLQSDTVGFVSWYDKESITININGVYNRTSEFNFTSEKEAIEFYSAVLYHEYRHTYQNTILGCNVDTFKRSSFDFFIESEADHYMIKRSDSNERKAIFKYDGSYKDYKLWYLNFPLGTIETSLDMNINQNVRNSPYIFSPIWDMIDIDKFYNWMNEQEVKHISSSNIDILSDYLTPTIYPVFLMDYEYKTVFPLRSNHEVITSIGQSYPMNEYDISRIKAVKQYEEITLRPSSADLRVITKSYLKNNNMYNAEGFAFVEVAFDDMIGIHARMQNNPGNGHFLKGESGHDDSDSDSDPNSDETGSRIIKIYENDCDQCEFVLANAASGEQSPVVTTYGATKIINDPENFEPRLNESSTDDPWTQWPNILIKHYYPWEDEEAYSWVDPGNALYVNHLKPVHVYVCTPVNFKEGDDGTIRDFSYDCDWQELSLSIENNYKITLTNCFKPLFENEVHVGFTANGTETCHYETSIIPNGEIIVDSGKNPLKLLLKSLSDVFSPRAYAHMHFIPARPNPEELFGIKTEKKRQVRQ